jgi:hypothetical protein
MALAALVAQLDACVIECNSKTNEEEVRSIYLEERANLERQIHWHQTQDQQLELQRQAQALQDEQLASSLQAQDNQRSDDDDEEEAEEDESNPDTSAGDVLQLARSISYKVRSNATSDEAVWTGLRCPPVRRSFRFVTHVTDEDGAWYRVC